METTFPRLLLQHAAQRLVQLGETAGVWAGQRGAGATDQARDRPQVFQSRWRAWTGAGELGWAMGHALIPFPPAQHFGVNVCCNTTSIKPARSTGAERCNA